MSFTHNTTKTYENNTQKHTAGIVPDFTINDVILLHSTQRGTKFKIRRSSFWTYLVINPSVIRIIKLGLLKLLGALVALCKNNVFKEMVYLPYLTIDILDSFCLCL